MAPNTKANQGLKHLEQLISETREENAKLKEQVKSLEGKMTELSGELQKMQFMVSENTERREVFESNVASVDTRCDRFESKIQKLTSNVEAQAQYSRKSTLIFAGKAVRESNKDVHKKTSSQAHT